MYKSLEYLPYKLLLKIAETGNIYLLSKEDKEPEEFTDDELEKFAQAWEKLEADHRELDPSGDGIKTLKIEREVAHFKAKYTYVLLCCEILSFDWDDQSAEDLLAFGYTLRDDDNYYPDLQRIVREAEGLITKAEKFESMLPKKDENATVTKTNVDELFASYSAILGFDFDYNTVSVTKVYAMQKSVEQKIKALQKQPAKK